jgi:hypothetical protein
MLAFVYSGPEGTFQICGWTVQSAFDRSQPSIRRVMASFKFPETRVAQGSPSGIVPLTPLGSVTSTPIRGETTDYAIRFPSDWTVKRNSEPYDALANSRSLYIGIIAEKANLGSSDFVQRFAEKNVRDAGATDVVVSDPIRVTIDSREWLQFVLKCTSKEGAPIGYQFYVYSGPEGTYQIVSWTAQNLFDREIQRVQPIAQTFTFPRVANSNASRARGTSSWRRISGRELACSIRIPADWIQKPASGDYAMIVSRDVIFVGVIAEEGDLGSPQTLVTLAQKRLAENATDVETGEARSMELDGRRWLQFSAKCAMDQQRYAFQFYVYAGPEGSYQVVGWALEELFDANADELRRVMRTFEFPK